MDTKDKIAVMQAYVDGTAIQFQRKAESRWLPLSKALGDVPPLWNWELYTYRAKPEPEVVYVNRRNDRSGMYAYRTSKEAKEVVERFSNEKMYEYIAKKFVAVEE